MTKTYVGVDLGCSAVSRGGPSSAVAILNAQGRLLGEPVRSRKAAELVEALAGHPHASMVMAVDAPRSVPDQTVENYAYRSCEKAIKKVDPHAGAFSGAAALFIRWHEIETRHFRNVKVIETYPRVTWARLKLPGKAKDFNRHRTVVYRAIKRITGVECRGFDHHQIDALLCAYTAFCYDRGKVELYGETSEGLIVIPAPGKGNPVPVGAERIGPRFRRFACMST